VIVLYSIVGLSWYKRTWETKEITGIKPTNIVNGQGLWKLEIESIEDKGNGYELYEDQSLLEKYVCYIHVNIDPWYYEMKYYLTHGSTPQYMEPKNRISLRLK
jgi:hypothetical protein